MFIASDKVLNTTIFLTVRVLPIYALFVIVSATLGPVILTEVNVPGPAVNCIILPPKYVSPLTYKLPPMPTPPATVKAPLLFDTA